MIREYIVPCKINLGLEVLAKRPDGYHELNTVFYRVMEPHDRITITESEYFHFTCSDPSLATSDNLVTRAANAWHRHLACALPNIHVHLDKRIPMGAGLGGGSSDAATILQILNEGNAIADDELLRMAASTGADVPFFLSNTKAAVATGIGEVLTPIELDLNASVLIVFDPSIHISTKEAYAGLKLAKQPIATNFGDLFNGTESLDDLDGVLRNDFEESIFAMHPKLALVKQQLYDHGASVALMSGSGSAVFGLFESEEVAASAKKEFSKHGMLAYL
jgi:4-diphosphocytidyl-2-C-methyl-D-erythritol kinase